LKGAHTHICVSMALLLLFQPSCCASRGSGSASACRVVPQHVVWRSLWPECARPILNVGACRPGRCSLAGYVLCAGICHLSDQNCTSFGRLFLQACYFAASQPLQCSTASLREVPQSCLLDRLMLGSIHHQLAFIWSHIPPGQFGFGRPRRALHARPCDCGLLLQQLLCPAATQCCKQVCWGSLGMYSRQPEHTCDAAHPRSVCACEAQWVSYMCLLSRIAASEAPAVGVQLSPHKKSWCAGRRKRPSSCMCCGSLFFMPAALGHMKCCSCRYTVLTVCLGSLFAFCFLLFPAQGGWRPACCVLTPHMPGGQTSGVLLRHPASGGGQ
jgi:hypothetical protein